MYGNHSLHPLGRFWSLEAAKAAAYFSFSCWSCNQWTGKQKKQNNQKNPKTTNYWAQIIFQGYFKWSKLFYPKYNLSREYDTVLSRLSAVWSSPFHALWYSLRNLWVYFHCWNNLGSQLSLQGFPPWCVLPIQVFTEKVLKPPPVTVPYWQAEHPSHRQQILWSQDSNLVRPMEMDWPNVE